MLTLSAALAAGSLWYPTTTVAIAFAAAATVLAHYFPDATARLFLRLLLFVLAGYAVLGRTFAGLGVYPVYVGEMVLAVGVLSLVANGWRVPLMRSPTVLLLVAFMAWGMVCTVPYLGTWGLFALRDAVLWGYGIFLIMTASLLVDRRLVGRVPEWFGRLVPWVILITPYWVLGGEWANRGGLLPVAIGGPKPGDAAVHLGGVGAFLLAGLSSARGKDGRRSGRFLEWVAWPALLLGIFAVGSWNRGGLLAALGALMVVLVMVPQRAGGKVLLAGVTTVFIFAAWLGSGISIQIREDRVINPEQIMENLGSVGGASGSDLDNTREWRLEWWKDIINYTVHGPYFWTGKGYGINLTYDDGIESDPDIPSRSPHNGNLTVLARSGVPGFVLWTAVQVSFVVTMLLGYLRARRLHQHTRASLFAWVFAYWCAFMVNASFDVYLEGPQGGIWFWCVMGYGLALVFDPSDPAVTRRPVRRASATARLAGSATA